MSEESLREAALSYLDKYDASVAQLRGVLLRRVARYAEESEAELLAASVERVLERLGKAALIDDQRFAEGFAAAARRRGASARKIEDKLAARGISSELARASVAETASEGLDELSAARAYVKKRRLLELDLKDEKQRRRALSSLARQGFSFDVARRALELP